MTPIIRIILFTVFGALAMRGIIPEDMARELANDAEIIGIVGYAVVAFWYYLAKKFGWKT